MRNRPRKEPADFDGPHALPIFLSAAVPLQMAELKKAGGPSESAWDRVRAFAPVLAEKGDQLLCRGKETASLMSELIFCLAVMAFAPGGVKLFGERWEAAIDGKEGASP